MSEARLNSLRALLINELADLAQSSINRKAA
jgi:hypothetical protein